MIEELYLCTDMPVTRKTCLSMENKKHLLLLRERLYYELPSGLAGFSDVFSSYIKQSDYEDIREELTKYWGVIVDETTETDLSHYEYYFSLFYTPICFWSLSIKRAINALQPKRLWISEAILESGVIAINDRFDNQASLNQWLLERCVLRHCRESGIETKRYPTQAPASYSRKIQKRKYLLDRVAQRIIVAADYFQDVEPLLCKLMDFLSLKRNRRLLMITQKGKSRRLQNALWNNGVKLQIKSYIEAKEEIGAGSFDYEYHYISSTREISAIRIWLTTISKYHDNSIDPNIEAFLGKFSNLLVTDGEHHPVVRRINKHIRSGNSRILLTIPEGGLEAFMSLCSLEDLKLEAHERLARCVLSEASSERLERIGKRGHSLLVLGYDTSLRISTFVGSLFRRALKAILEGKKSPIIFYDYPRIADDVGIVRTNAPADIQIINAMKTISAALEATGYPIIIHTHYIDQFRKYCDNPFVESCQHWSVNAMCSDLVITSFSSIAVECLAVGKPVIIWHPYTETKSFFDHLACEDDCRKIMRIVTCIEDLHGAIQDLLNTHKNDFHAAKRFIPWSNHALVAKEIAKLIRDLDTKAPLI